MTEKPKEYLAHISEDGSRYHSLYEHLKGTAEKASEFASAFGCGEWGYLAGSEWG